MPRLRRVCNDRNRTICILKCTHTHTTHAKMREASSSIAEINAKTVMAKERVENGVHCVALLFTGVCRVSSVFGAQNFIDEKVSRVFFNFSFNDLIYACMCAFSPNACSMTRASVFGCIHDKQWLRRHSCVALFFGCNEGAGTGGTAMRTIEEFA